MSAAEKPSRSQSSSGGPSSSALHTPSPRAAAMELSVTVALDRDAQHTLDLSLVPQGHLRRPTSWLLLHGIPATASLPLALRRLRAAAEGITTSLATSTTTTTNNNNGAAEYNEHGSLPVSPARPASTAPLTTGTPVVVVTPISAVLVGYVVSEVHAYCLLISCQSPHIAEQIKRHLEKEAAPGTAAPVDFVEPEGVVTSHDMPSASGSPGGTTATRANSPREKLPLDRVLFSCCIAVRGGAFVDPDAPDGATASTGTSGPRTPCGPPRRVSSSPVLSPKLPLPASCGQRRSAGAAAGNGSGGEESPPSRGDSAYLTRSPLSLPFTHSMPPALHEDCSICQTDALYARPVVITLCHHAFHMDCYSQLLEGASDCPLCRFSLCDLQNDARCGVCGTFEDLWVCLVCGFTGCGRARLHHQQQHSQALGHSCAVQATTGRIWDSRAGLFLHQEVAVQLGDDEESKAATAEAAKRQASWWRDDDDDDDLRAALTESKENAVGQFYVDVLQRLLTEQTEWFASGCPGLATGPAASGATPGRASKAPQARPEPLTEGETADAADRFAALVAEEASQRQTVVRLYVGELQSLCAQESILLSTLAKRNTRQQREAQELIMLQCHQNAGLKQRGVRVTAQLEKLRVNGKAEEAAKRAQLEQYEARATELLTKLS